MDYTTVQALVETWDLGSEPRKLLAALITGATNQIRKHTKREFASETATARVFDTTRHYDPFDGDLLLLPDEIAEEPESVVDGSSTDITADCTYLDPYTWPAWGIIYASGWTKPITVTAHWAYSKTPPADVEFACMRLAKWMLEMGLTTRADGVVVTDQGAVLLPSKLPQDVLALLAPYVRPSVGGFAR